jgi:hypothetical protein
MRLSRNLLACLIVLANLTAATPPQTLSPDFSARSISRGASPPPEGPGLLPDFVLLSAGIAGIPLYAGANPAWAYWHPASASFSRPSVFYSHSVRHFPAAEVAVSNGKRRNVDQLDADLVVHSHRTLWGGVARFFSVAGEWGFDHQAQTLAGFPKRRADGRLDGFARARKIFPWLVYGCSNSTVRFRSYSHGIHFASWSSYGSKCGIIIRIFPWLSFGTARGSLLLNGSFASAPVSSLGTSSLFAVHIAFFRWFSASSITHDAPAGILRAHLLTFPFLTRGFYEFSIPFSPDVRSGRVLSFRLPLPGLTLGYGEIKDAISLLLAFPGDRPENLPAPPMFRDIHIAFATLSP